MLLFGRTVQEYVFSATQKSGISIPNPTYQFPRGTHGSVSHTFRIYNVRPQRLIMKAQPDCGCTGVSWKNASVPPFGWKDLTATMEVKPNKIAAIGRSVAITIETDDRNTPYLFAFLKS